MNENGEQRYFEEQVDLIDYIKIIVCNRWMIIKFTFLCVLSTYLIGTFYYNNDVYLSTSILLTDKQTDFLNTGIDDNIIKKDIYLTILNSNIVTKNVMEKQYDYVIDDNRFKTDLYEYFNVDSAANIQRLLSGITEIQSEKNGILKINARSKSPNLSAGIANEFVEQLIIYNQKYTSSNATINIDFIDDRLEKVKEELDSARAELVNFITKNKQLTLKDINVENEFPLLVLERNRLNQEIKLKSDLFNTLSNQFELSKIEAQKDIPVITVIDYALPARSPEKGNTKRNLLIAFFVGGFVSITLAFIINYITELDEDTKFYFSKEFNNEKMFISNFRVAKKQSKKKILTKPKQDI